ncbi:MAG: response regulator [Deltaproteobacteria bacterium]|nr:response regulator [Deltaproteobacteria bacterium]
MTNRKTLVVDNEKVIVEMIAGILEQNGCQVEKAYGGLEAIEKLKHNKFDIVFLDLIMPRVGGDRICRFIRQAPEHAGTKVVIVTAVAIEAETKIAELHPDACVAKAAYPFLKDNITKVLQSLDKQDTPPEKMVLGRDGVHNRTVVSELLFAQRHFEAILNSMSEGVIELDTDHVITYVNPAAQNLLGKQEWELIGRKFVEGVPIEKIKDIEKVFSGLCEPDHFTTREYSLKNNNREFSFSFRNVFRDKELIGFTVVVNDITERKLLEKEFHIRERLTGVIEMAGAAAHELNQPLAVISGHSQLLLRDTQDCSDKISRRIRIIFDQVERLGELTKKFTSIVVYKTKDFGKNITIVDIEKACRSENDSKFKGMWDI